jgi:HEAT repeat protein
MPALRSALEEDGDNPDPMLRGLRRVPWRHRREVADALLEPLRVVRGSTVDRTRLVATRLGLIDEWRRALVRGSWPSRTRAAHALGLMRDRDAVPALITLLDSANHEVRAAVVDALGMIGDVTALQALLPRIGQQSRHQQARLVEALRRIGPAVTDSIVQLQATDPADRRLIAEVLALVGGTGARSTLLDWAQDEEPTVRAAAWRAIGVTGMDDRVAYHALRALTDPDPRVRAHAAQALGRTGRVDFVPYLSQHLDDEWEVAAQGARALSRLGVEGLAALRAREATGAGGHGLELARHFLWEHARA